MKKTLAILVVLVLAGVVYAGQKYNPYTNTWETTRPGWVLKYNAMGDAWHYAPPNAQPTYNPMENRWDMAPPGAVQKYNPYTGHWETTDPDWVLQPNPSNQGHQWQYGPTGPEYNPMEERWEEPHY